MFSVTLLLCIEVALVTEAKQANRGGGGAGGRGRREREREGDGGSGKGGERGRERALPPAHGGTFVPEMNGLVGSAQKKLLSAEPSPSLESGGGGCVSKASLCCLFCLLDCHCVKVNEVSEFPVISNKSEGRG